MSVTTVSPRAQNFTALHEDREFEIAGNSAGTSTTGSEESTPRQVIPGSARGVPATGSSAAGVVQQLQFAAQYRRSDSTGGFTNHQPEDDDLLRVVDTWLEKSDSGSPERVDARRANLVATLQTLRSQLDDLKHEVEAGARQGNSGSGGPSCTTSINSASGWPWPSSASSTGRSPRTPRGSSPLKDASNSARTSRDLRIAAETLLVMGSRLCGAADGARATLALGPRPMSFGKPSRWMLCCGRPCLTQEKNGSLGSGAWLQRQSKEVCPRNCPRHGRRQHAVLARRVHPCCPSPNLL